MPASVVKIGEGAFSECSGIVDLHLPDVLETIGDAAFYQYSSIVALHLPDALKAVGCNSFKGCSAIVATERLVVAEGTTEIPAYAYRGRVDINEVVLPASVIKIGPYAFCGCSGIVDAHLPRAQHGLSLVTVTTSTSKGHHHCQDDAGAHRHYHAHDDAAARAVGAWQVLQGAALLERRQLREDRRGVLRKLERQHIARLSTQRQR